VSDAQLLGEAPAVKHRVHPYKAPDPMSIATARRRVAYGGRPTPGSGSARHPLTGNGDSLPPDPARHGELKPRPLQIASSDALLDQHTDRETPASRRDMEFSSPTISPERITQSSPSDRSVTSMLDSGSSLRQLHARHLARLHPDTGRSAPKREALPAEPDRLATTHRARGVPAMLYAEADAATRRSRVERAGTKRSSSALVDRIMRETYGPVAAAQLRTSPQMIRPETREAVSASMREIAERIEQGTAPLSGKLAGDSGAEAELHGHGVAHRAERRNQEAWPQSSPHEGPFSDELAESESPASGRGTRSSLRQMSSPQLSGGGRATRISDASAAPPIGGRRHMRATRSSLATQPGRSPRRSAGSAMSDTSSHSLPRARVPKAFRVRPAGGGGKTGLLGGDAKAAEVTRWAREHEAEQMGHLRGLERRLGLPRCYLDGADAAEIARARARVLGETAASGGALLPEEAAEAEAVRWGQRGAKTIGRPASASRRASVASSRGSAPSRPGFDFRSGPQATTEAEALRRQKQAREDAIAMHRRAELRAQSAEAKQRQRAHSGYAPPITDTAYERLTGKTGLVQLENKIKRKSRRASASRPGSARRSRPSSARSTRPGSARKQEYSEEWLRGLPSRLLRQGPDAGGLMVARPLQRGSDKLSDVHKN
jgi:hypothetical protein